MFDTEKFILEVQKRESIWNITKSSLYNDRLLRRQSWIDVTAIMCEGFEFCSNRKKSEKVIELQKKWKSLRDYYIREKKKDESFRESGITYKRRKSPYLDLLNFLSVTRNTKTPLNTSRPVETASSNFVNTEASADNASASVMMMNERRPQRTRPFTEFVVEPVMGMSCPAENNPNMNFLLSIIPEMNAMDERQVFEFKLDIMKLIKKIRYEPDSYNQPNVPCQRESNKPDSFTSQPHEDPLESGRSVDLPTIVKQEAQYTE